MHCGGMLTVFGKTEQYFCAKCTTKARLEYLRGELRAECISYGELHELQSLAKHIDPHDVELLEAAGVSEADYLKGLAKAGGAS